MRHHLSVPAGIYLFKVNNRNTRTRCRHWRRSGVFIVNFEHISHLVLVFLLLTLNKQMPAEVSFVQRTFTWYFLLVSDRTSSICYSGIFHCVFNCITTYCISLKNPKKAIGDSLLTSVKNIGSSSNIVFLGWFLNYHIASNARKNSIRSYSQLIIIRSKIHLFPIIKKCGLCKSTLVSNNNFIFLTKKTKKKSTTTEKTITQNQN